MEQTKTGAPVAEETSTGPMLMVVTLKSGVQIRMDVAKYTVGVNGFGALVRLKWTGTDESRAAIKFVDIDEVAAVHTEWPEGTPSVQGETVTIDPRGIL